MIMIMVPNTLDKSNVWVSMRVACVCVCLCVYLCVVSICMCVDDICVYLYLKEIP